MQSDDFSDDCSGENVNVEGHVAIDNGNSGEGDVSTFSMLGCNSAHIRLTKLPNVYAMYIFPVSILGFENCQSFFPTTAHVRTVCRNARRTAMRGAPQMVVYCNKQLCK